MSSDTGFGKIKEPSRRETLVPGKLIGFRRFFFNRADQSLRAVSNTSFIVSPGENTAEHLGFMGMNGHSAVACGDGVYKASDNVPLEGCTCGFYGYCTPELIDTTYNSNVWTCCAVVEVWGKVILGTKGFRAEKMRILGVVPPSEMRQKMAPLEGDYTFASYMRMSLHETYLGTLPAWQTTVAAYGVTEYATIKDMVAAHPPQDVSHLIPGPEPEPESDPSIVRSHAPVAGTSWAPTYPSMYAMGPSSSISMSSWVPSGVYLVDGVPCHLARANEIAPVDHQILPACTCHWCEDARKKLRDIAEDATKDTK